MSKGSRTGLALALTVVFAGFTFWAISTLLSQNPSAIDYTQGHSAGQPVNITLETVGSYGSGAHPTWVSYDAMAPNGQWVHSTNWMVPAGVQVNVTLNQYDSGSPLRNQQVGLIAGTLGSVANINGKNVSLVNSNVGNGVGHTFSIPALGVNVPLVGVNPNLTLCSAAPCQTSSPHNVIKFSFTTPKGGGNFRWQCFVPCGLGFLYGNGGPMSTTGYMGGFVEVVQ